MSFYQLGAIKAEKDIENHEQSLSLHLQSLFLQDAYTHC